MNEEATAKEAERLARYKALKARQKLSVPYEAPRLAVAGETLAEAEIEFFMEHGFLVKHDLLEHADIDAAVDRIWDHLTRVIPPARGSNWRLQRDDPASWVNPEWSRQPGHPDSGPFQGRQPVEHYGRIVKLHDLGNAPFILDLVANNPQVRTVAQALLGEDLKPNAHTRGVYLVFPTRNPDDPTGAQRLTGAALGPHTDQVCQQLNACAYLEDVAPRNGGFTVYPGSHKLMFNAHEYEANWSPHDGFMDSTEEVVESIEPLELVAKKGSVVFWHGRLMHSVGIHVGDSIRWAMFADFTQNRSSLSDDEHRAVGQYEWFKDAKLFRDDHPVARDMWQSWAIG